MYEFKSSVVLCVFLQGKTRVCEIESHVANYLQSLGMRDTDLFGLSFKIGKLKFFFKIK